MHLFGAPSGGPEFDAVLWTHIVIFIVNLGTSHTVKLNETGQLHFWSDLTAQ